MIGIMTALILVGNPINISTTNTIQNVAQPIAIESQVAEAVQEEVYIQEQDVIETADIQATYSSEVIKEVNIDHSNNQGWIEIEWDAIEIIDENNGWMPAEFTAIEIVEG